MSVALDDLHKMVEVLMKGNRGDHFGVLGARSRTIERAKVSKELPFNPQLVGNPRTGAIHGGVITALLDSCSGLAASTVLEELVLTPTIDLRIDYLGYALPGDVLIAEAEVYRLSKHVVFTRGIAHCGDPDRPVAHSVGNFIRIDPEQFSDFREGVNRGYERLRQSQSASGEYAAAAPAQDFEVDLGFAVSSRLAGDVNGVIDSVPYGRLLGMRASVEQGCYLLPPRASNVGNPTLPALHGGALAGFMEMSAAMEVVMRLAVDHIPKVVDFSIEYIRPARLEETHARCEIVRFGRKLVQVAVDAWQQSDQQPVAKARAHFILD